MSLPLYSLIVSCLYGLLWLLWPSAAEAAVIAFVALLLVPALYDEQKRTRR